MASTPVQKNQRYINNTISIGTRASKVVIVKTHDLEGVDHSKNSWYQSLESVVIVKTHDLEG